MADMEGKSASLVAVTRATRTLTNHAERDFPVVIKLRYSHPDFRRQYRIPGEKARLWTAGIQFDYGQGAAVPG
jgi:hypothetical protein